MVSVLNRLSALFVPCLSMCVCVCVCVSCVTLMVPWWMVWVGEIERGLMSAKCKNSDEMMAGSACMCVGLHFIKYFL